MNKKSIIAAVIVFWVSFLISNNFFPGSEPIKKEAFLKDGLTIPLDKNAEGIYRFSLKYMVFYDQQSEHLVDALNKDFTERLKLFDNFLSQKTYNKMIPESELVFMNIKELGGESLYYDRPATKWITDLYNELDSSHYDVLVFNPISNIDWCNDAPSQGFNYRGKIFFCLEAHNNPTDARQNERAIKLIIHKLFHGLGYNHQTSNHKQYVFLDWDIGMPDPKNMPFDRLFFNKHVHKTLGLIDKTSGFERSCLDLQMNQFICKPSGQFKCADSWGPFCYDVDQDGIVDSEDEYVFSSPKKGVDSDKDGIIDELDLCDWNKIEILAENAKIGPMKIVSLEDNLSVEFKSETVLIRKIIATPMSMVGASVKFPKTDAMIKKGNKISLNEETEQPKNKMWRLGVVYFYKNKEYYRPYYVYFPGLDMDFFYDREWYYFNRFGCDIPLSVDFADLNTYDPDATGLPSPELFEWAKKIDENYDWDGDGVPDIKDTLPTIPGNCSNDYVRGVPDSSGDGFCDPGIFDFTLSKYLEPHEILIVYYDHPFVDLCPYIAGPNQGCP